MNYTVKQTINIPREKMLVLFEDLEFMKKWQDGFKSLDVIEGQPGTVGSKSRLVYEMRGKNTEMIETIIHKALPDRFDFLYEAKGVTNWANNTFVAQAYKTLWIAEHSFKFTGFMAFMSKFMKGAFVKQTSKDMLSFKKHAEAKQ